MTTAASDKTADRHFDGLELGSAAVYGLVLIWINAYICRELFLNEAAYMNSMQGFWTALARLGPGNWFHSTWWPFWDCGVPFEFTYAPLVPALTSACAAVRGIPHTVAFQSISGMFYRLLPATLFLMAWLLTRSPGYSFLAGLFYSLTAPVQLVAPDEGLSWTRFWEARRFYLTAVWDETPHFGALTLLPLAVLFLALSIRTRRLRYYVASVTVIALSALASAFGPVMIGMAAVCLLCTLRTEEWKRNVATTAAIGAFTYAIVSPWLSPSLIHAMRDSSAITEGGWTAGSVTALGLVALGWVILWRYLPGWTADWRLRFFALFAYITTSIPFIDRFLHRQFLPQPGRYKNEMELAVTLLVVFAAKVWLEKLPGTVRAAVVFVLLGIAGEQVVSHRKFAKNVFFAPHDLSKTVESRLSRWVEGHLPGVRVMMPGSAAQWANAFSDVQQLTGGSWSMAHNQIVVLATQAIYDGGPTAERDAHVSLTWLKAYGVGAVGISGARSGEFWKPFKRPAKFEGLLPVLWKEDEVTLYGIPRQSASLAHVTPESAIVRGGSRMAAPAMEEIERYVASLDDPSMPVAELDWVGRNSVRVRTSASAGQVISVQVSHHPGWHATVNGQARAVERDGLGLMWISPGCNGACEVELDYDGGWELRMCHYLSLAAIAALLLLPFRGTILGAAQR